MGGVLYSVGLFPHLFRYTVCRTRTPRVSARQCHMPHPRLSLRSTAGNKLYSIARLLVLSAFPLPPSSRFWQVPHTDPRDLAAPIGAPGAEADQDPKKIPESVVGNSRAKALLTLIIDEYTNNKRIGGICIHVDLTSSYQMYM